MRIALWIGMFLFLPFAPFVSGACIALLALHSAYLATPAMEKRNGIIR